MNEHLVIGNRTIHLDSHGYLLDPDLWDLEVAKAMARRIDVELSDERWFVINFVREYFETNQSVPETRFALKAMKQSLGHEKGTRRYLYELFPYGYAQQACKIAGMRIPLKLMLDL